MCKGGGGGPSPGDVFFTSRRYSKKPSSSLLQIVPVNVFFSTWYRLGVKKVQATPSKQDLGKSPSRLCFIEGKKTEIFCEVSQLLDTH